jgi:hypothetical protein
MSVLEDEALQSVLGSHCGQPGIYGIMVFLASQQLL